MIINKCDISIPAYNAPCCLPTIDLTVSMFELMSAMKEGKVIYNNQTVKSLKHLQQLYNEWRKKQDF